MPQIADKESFLVGVQVGRRMKVLVAKRKLDPIDERDVILTEYGEPILTEAGDELTPQGGV